MRACRRRRSGRGRCPPWPGRRLTRRPPGRGFGSALLCTFLGRGPVGAPSPKACCVRRSGAQAEVKPSAAARGSSRSTRPPPRSPWARRRDPPAFAAVRREMSSPRPVEPPPLRPRRAAPVGCRAHRHRRGYGPVCRCIRLQCGNLRVARCGSARCRAARRAPRPASVRASGDSPPPRVTRITWSTARSSAARSSMTRSVTADAGSASTSRRNAVIGVRSRCVSRRWRELHADPAHGVQVSGLCGGLPQFAPQP